LAEVVEAVVPVAGELGNQVVEDVGVGDGDGEGAADEILYGEVQLGWNWKGREGRTGGRNGKVPNNASDETQKQLSSA
tara:strand:- start:1127 stop:1360 length:234 start_codon:yes stop_codon:yes gene_type:complete